MSEVRLTRHFATDAATVFDFVTRPEHLEKWWGPDGMTLPDYVLDLRTPGKWHSVIMNADGKRFKMSGEVISVDPPHSVEFTWGWHDESDSRGHESTVKFTVTPDGKGGTEFVVHHTGLADDESAANHEMGWTSTLRKLERLAN